MKKIVFVILALFLCEHKLWAGPKNPKKQSKIVKNLVFSDIGSKKKLKIQVRFTVPVDKKKSEYVADIQACGVLESSKKNDPELQCLVLQDPDSIYVGKYPINVLAEKFNKDDIRMDSLGIYPADIKDVMSGAQVEFLEQSRQNFSWGQVTHLVSNSTGSSDVIYVLNQIINFNIRIGPAPSMALRHVEFSFDF